MNWSPQALAIWERLAATALAQVGRALAELIGQPVQLQETGIRPVSWPQLGVQLGGPDPAREPVYGVHLGAVGLFRADIFLIFAEESARRVVAMLTGEEPEAPLQDELGGSALRETGNILGSAFLNVFADAFGQAWEPTPPQLWHGPLAAGLAAAMPDTKVSQLVLVTEAVFRVRGQAASGYLAVVPRARGGAA